MKSHKSRFFLITVCVALLAALSMTGCNAPAQEEEEDHGILTGLLSDIWGVSVDVSDDSQSVTVCMDMVDGEEWVYQVNGAKKALAEPPTIEMDDDIWTATFTAVPKKSGEVTINFLERYAAGNQEVAREYRLILNIDANEGISPVRGDGYQFPAEWCWVNEEGCIEINLPNQKWLQWSIEPRGSKVVQAALEPIDEHGVTAAAYQPVGKGKTTIDVNLFDDEGNLVTHGYVRIKVNKALEVTSLSNGWDIH